jgi:hypothetical protein
MALLQKAYLGANPLFRDIKWYDTPANVISSVGLTTLTSSTTTHTKGSYTELIASTTANATYLYCVIQTLGGPSTNSATLIDIATGASGSETVIAGNIAIGGARAQLQNPGLGNTPGVVFGFPFQVPSSTRIAARIQSVTNGSVGRTCQVACYVLDAGDYANAPTSVDVIGPSTANSEGISFSGASGTWVEGIASTTRAYRAVVLVPSVHNAVIQPQDNVGFDVGVGASGSEVAFGRIICRITGAEDIGNQPPFVHIFGRNIPSGSRLAVRHEIINNPDRHGFTLIGIP